MVKCLTYSMILSELDIDKRYSYADYYGWDFPERVELIDGKVFVQDPITYTVHQRMSIKLANPIWKYLKGRAYEIFAAPFDGRFPTESLADDKIWNVVQPDLCICNKAVLDERGCLGAPDIVIEILSPGNSIIELNNKFDLYESAGVKEYWLVSPQDNTVVVNTLQDGKYITARPITSGSVLKSSILPSFSLDLSELFGEE